MSANKIDLGIPLSVLETVARVGSIASITVLILLFKGEGLHPSEVAPQEWIGLVFFPIGVIAGMIIAWWKEGIGSAISVSSLIAFYVIYGFLLRNHLGGWAFFTFTLPAFLFLVHWLLRDFAKEHARVRSVSKSHRLSFRT